jgi:hypothetical protein
VSNNNVIELNGNRYDAVTGKIISAGTASSQIQKKPAVAKSVVPKHVSKTLNLSKVRQQPAKSSTLMRSSVKKPVQHPVHNVTSFRTRPAQTQVPKNPKVSNLVPVGAIDPHRIARANHIPKNMQISRFGARAKSIALADVPVKSAPQSPATIASRKAVHQAQKATATAKNPFEQALQSATSHEQPRLRKTRAHHRIAKKLHISPRTFLLGSATLVAVVIGSFLAYTRVPSVAMKVASTKAGINAALPTYQPAGFSVRGPITTSPGEISVSYKSNSDERDFKLTQKTSSWNSEALLGNFVETAKQASYQTFQSAGRTIYIYDGSNATWVDGGIWYKIEGNSSLNSDQLLRIANSL